jgi:hypothetical protein
MKHGLAGGGNPENIETMAEDAIGRNDVNRSVPRDVYIKDTVEWPGRGPALQMPDAGGPSAGET